MVTRRRFAASLLLPWAMPTICAASNGKNVTRIATPDRAATETVLALGMCPVAAAVPQVYAAMHGFPSLPAGVANVGHVAEPNVEVMRSLDVQLIVIEAMSLGNQDVLERVAPVFVLNIYTGSGNPDFVSVAKTEMFRLARRIGREAVAERYWLEVQDRIMQARERLRGRAGRPVFIVQFGLGGGDVLLYARNCVTFDVMRQLGFENAWVGATNAYGCAQVGMEQLAAIPDADIFYIDYGVETRASLKGLAESPIWTNLPMVKAGRVYPIAPFDPLGSLPTAIQFTDNFEAAIRRRG